MTLTKDDQDQIKMCIENAVMKSMQIHHDQIDALIDKKIASHQSNCPVGVSVKMKMQFIAGMAFAFSLIGGVVGTVATKFFGVIK